MASPFFDKTKPFAELGLDRRVFKAIAKLGFVYPTIAQAQVNLSLSYIPYIQIYYLLL